jgi:hypothetical protein
MQLLLKRTSLLAACLLMSGGAARASTLEVTVPFAFTVHGQAMPAGRYRVVDDSGVVSISGEKGNRARIMVMSIPAPGHDPKGRQPELTFQKHETQYRLSQIWESTDEGREIKP